MKKLSFLFVVFLMAQLSYGLPSLTYQCGFEAGEQGSSFTTGALTGQGTPAWNYGWYGNDLGGNVTSTDKYDGSQSAVVGGYQCSWIDFGTQYVPKWIEFAFKPQFDGTNDDSVEVRTTRGPYYENFGIYMYLDSSNGGIGVWDLEAGAMVNCGQYANNQWQTISFKHNVVEYPEESGDMIYDGTFDVYLNGQLAKTSLGYTGVYYCMQTLMFRTSESTKTHGGIIGFDGINIGEESIYVPEPATMSLLAIGLAAMLRRRNA